MTASESSGLTLPTPMHSSRSRRALGAWMAKCPWHQRSQPLHELQRRHCQANRSVVPGQGFRPHSPVPPSSTPSVNRWPSTRASTIRVSKLVSICMGVAVLGLPPVSRRRPPIRLAPELKLRRALLMSGHRDACTVRRKARNVCEAVGGSAPACRYRAWGQSRLTLPRLSQFSAPWLRGLVAYAATQGSSYLLGRLSFRIDISSRQ